MRNFKKFTVIFFVAIFMFVTLSGCGKRGECEECGQNEKLNKYVDQNDNIRWYCDDCYKMAKLFGI